MILASDFDGTILIDGKISQKDIKAIRDFQEAGNLFAIVTGRSYASLLPLIEGKIAPDIIIANNGGHIFVEKYGQLIEIFTVDIPIPKARKFLDYYAGRIDNEMSIFTESARLSKIEDVKEPIMALATYSDTEIPNYFPEDFDFHYSIGVIDVVKKGINKQRGIEIIKEYYKFDGEIIAIGDDYNDIIFLKETPNSYTLDHVTNKEVRAAANHSVRSIFHLIDKLREGI